jgi:cytochrome c biogenesis protein CcdA/thiol-disulfide isomerase/thioredoxin
MLLISLFAFLAGGVTVLSSCIIPVLPLLLSASADRGKYRPLGILCGVALSFSFFILAVGSLVHVIGISPDVLRWGALVLIMFFGVSMLIPALGTWLFSWVHRITRVGAHVQEESAYVGTGFGGGFIFGSALGMIWTPCAGPILAAVTTAIATQPVTIRTVLIALAYSVGSASVMALIVFGGQKALGTTTFLNRYAESIRKILGLIMIGGALAIMVHLDVHVQRWVAQYVPAIKVEEATVIKEALGTLLDEQAIGYHAPEFSGIVAWLNSEPLTMAQLRGKVVLVDFWTYSCINCIRTLPHLKHLYDTYKDKGFVLVGVHTPEFEFEKKLENVKHAITRFGIPYPVALDNEYKTWQRYANHYWPAHYIIDQQGIIRETHFGEGGYQKTENTLRTLLGLSSIPGAVQQQGIGRPVTPETYLGYRRVHAYASDLVLSHNRVSFYTYQEPLGHNQVGLHGAWVVNADFIQSKSDFSVLDLNFIARHVFLVMHAEKKSLVNVYLDGKPLEAQYGTQDMHEPGVVAVQEPRMYALVDVKNDYGRHLLSLRCPEGVSCYVFTFGA